MADRRFNLGRQGEQLMNDNLFKAYNRIKYVGNGLDVPKQEYQTPILDYSLWINRATTTSNDNVMYSDVMHVYDQSSKTWNPMFKGYYHPVNLKEQPLFPVNGQIYIDINGVLRYYEDKRWKIVAAASADNTSTALMGIDNFLIMPDMVPLSNTECDYLVPAARVGRLFDNKKYITKHDYFENDMRITYPINDGTLEEKLTWIHVNPSFLIGTRKRLIKVLETTRTNDNYFISVPTYNTEYYGFKEGEPLGTLMRYIQDSEAVASGELVDLVSDYRIVSGGIQLMNEGRNYDYIYAITYEFDAMEHSPGSVIMGSTTVSDNNQIHVGHVAGFPLVFLGGLYYDTSMYNYDLQEGTISFNDDGISFYYDPVAKEIVFKILEKSYKNPDGTYDVEAMKQAGIYLSGEDEQYDTGEEELDYDNGNAPIYPVMAEELESKETHNEITGDLDLVVAAFADVIRYDLIDYPNTERHQRPPFEIVISPEYTDENGVGILEHGRIENGEIYIQHEYIKQAADFKHPIAFVQGVGVLYDEEYGITDEIELNTATGEIIVKNFGPKDDSIKELKMIIADIGDAKLSYGYTTTDGRIVDERIREDYRYLVFINGVCTSPSDHIVYDGYIELDDLIKDTQYFLMSLEEGDKGVDLIFDSSVASFTFRIEDQTEGYSYNDCNMALSYITDEDGEYNGLLIDRTMLQANDMGEESYVTGEIIYLRDTENEDAETYTYKIFNANGDYEWTRYADTFGDDQVQILDSIILQLNTAGSISIMNAEYLKGKTVNYYAYTYSDETDEPILRDSNGNYRMAVRDHLEDAGIPENQDFYVRRIHYYYPANKGILSTFVNGLHVRSYDSENVECKYHIPTHANISFNKTWGNECDLYNVIKAITPETSLNDLMLMKEGEFSEELKNFPMTYSVLERFQALHDTLVEIETTNRLDYFVEKIESGESYSADKQWCTHANRYMYFDNTYTSPTYFAPGNVDVYLNGVMLDRDSYSIFDSCRIILNDLNVAGGSDEYDANNKDTHRLIKYYIKEYDEELGRDAGRVERIYCESPDEVLIEYKPDTSIRKTSYEIKEPTYDTGILSYDDYQFPTSLLNTKDEVKIWIDGILYTGGYKISKKDIILKENPLQMDPIKLYFDTHPDTYKEWKQKNGEYSYRKSRIIFEWR